MKKLVMLFVVLMVSLATLSGFTPATDDFNRTDNTTLGTDWGVNSDQELRITSNHTANDNNDVEGCDVRTLETFDDDQYSQAVVTSNNDFHYTVVQVRGSGTSTATHNSYRFIVDDGVGTEFSGIWKVINGVGTQLTTGLTLSASAGDVQYISVVGNAITAKLNGSTVASTTDNDITTGKPGICLNGNTAGLDDFEADSLAAAPPAEGPCLLGLLGVGCHI